jgi:hypothetical protein
MRDQLVTFDIAKLAKEKGFNEEVRDWYNPTQDDELKPEGGGDMLEKYNSTDHLLSAPTQSLLQRWLRELHFTFINIAIYKDREECDTTYDYAITDLNNPYDINDNEIFKEDYGITEDRLFKTYEQALEKGLIETLKLIK